MEQRPSSVSVIDPISPAIDRVKLMLFRPFDLGKWFTVGFCAWLAYLGTGGGRGGGGGPHGNISHKSGQSQAQMKEEISEGVYAAKEYIWHNLHWIIPTTIIIAVAIICLGLIITWLSSRGKFMFLHCVAQNKSEVKIPWCKFRKHGNSLFLFRFILGIIYLVIIMLPVTGIILLALAITSGVTSDIASASGIIFLVSIIITISIILFLVRKFTFDFVVPIMFLQTESCTAAWRQFLTILSVNKARLTLYLLFQIVISIAITTIIMMGACIGCCFCCVSVLLFVPYIGTVILLPLFVFKRAYSLYYLRQFGPDFDVFSPPTNTTPQSMP